MGFRFRRSISLGKSVRLNISKSGAGISGGAPPDLRPLRHWPDAGDILLAKLSEADINTIKALEHPQGPTCCASW